MSQSIQIELMRSAILRGKVEWQRHALERMAERGIMRAEVKEALLHGERIEDYPEDYPLPSALFLGTVQSRPLHVVAAYDAGIDTAYIITAYEPSLDYFEPDWRTRRRKA
jgi:hypothetical protein